MTYDAAFLATSNKQSGLVAVYALHSGELLTSFNTTDPHAGRFDAPAKLCLSASDTLLLVESGAKRVHELTLFGYHVLYIGVVVINVIIAGFAANQEYVAVSKADCSTSQRVMVFSYATGALLHAFGEFGEGPGQLRQCYGLCFTPDERHVLIAEANTPGRLSLFTVAGAFVKCIGDEDGVLSLPTDVQIADNGDIIVVDSGKGAICVFRASDHSLAGTWGAPGSGNGQFQKPITAAVCCGQTYVLDLNSARVQVFE